MGGLICAFDLWYDRLKQSSEKNLELYIVVSNGTVNGNLTYVCLNLLGGTWVRKEFLICKHWDTLCHIRG